MKPCTRCLLVLPLEDFHVNNKGKMGRASRCKACINEVRRETGSSKSYHERNRDQRLIQLREGNVLRRFGLTPEEYDEMYTRQGGLCAICWKQCPTGRRLAVDHDHET